MDPVIFRITLTVLSATGGIGLIFYGFAWLLVPYDDEDENEVRKLLTGRVDGQALTGVLFALVGCGVFLTMLSNTSVLTFAVVLSLLLAGAGYWSRNRGTPDPDPLSAQAVADAPPEAQAPPVPGLTTRPGGATPSSRTARMSAARAICGGRETPATATSRRPSTSAWAPPGADARTSARPTPAGRSRAAPAGSAAGSSSSPCWRAASAPERRGSTTPWAPACRPVCPAR